MDFKKVNRKQRIPQELLIELAKSAKGPLYHLLKERDYTMPADTSAYKYDEDYSHSALKTFFSGPGSSSADYAVNKLIDDFEQEKIISYLSNLGQAPYSNVSGQYRHSVNPEDPDTAYIYHRDTHKYGGDAESALRTLMHENFLHGVGGTHRKKLHRHSQGDYPMYGDQDDYDLMETNLMEELKDNRALIKMYTQLEDMLPYDYKYWEGEGFLGDFRKARSLVESLMPRLS